ncbi:hypothetical protein SUGI_0247220, partial [Cryptomeria japonica]
SIPSSLGNLSSLIHFSLPGNNLTGFVPVELGNNLSRAIPEKWSGHLVTFLFDENEQAGNIPVSLSNLSTLEQLSISRNKVTGFIPQELGRLAHMKNLHLQVNQLSGPVPSSLSNCSVLQELGLSDHSGGVLYAR